MSLLWHFCLIIQFFFHNNHHNLICHHFDFSCHNFSLIILIYQSIFSPHVMEMDIWINGYMDGYIWISRGDMHEITGVFPSGETSKKQLRYCIYYWYTDTERGKIWKSVSLLFHSYGCFCALYKEHMQKTAYALIGLLARSLEQQIKVMFTSVFLQRSFFRAWDQIILSLNTHIYYTYTKCLSFFHLCKNTLSATQTWQSHGVSL